ncbi:TetR/AcrR family transcriptional regulator [Ornithinimicrobium faecis]|uniref:TetR/AcrR family transcriptional regulator n=1 Tax=Ornithinimicrobium faecis TaxID=2934158 RepID=UPI0021176EA7|nr:TetR family transcriptional regulator [Ornithinimicrobium sp. HY1745]
MVVTRRERTHERLLTCALALFEAQGFESTTTAQIAAAAGVTEMTFFRHFASKARVVTTDPYDPMIADGIATQPHGLPPLVRAARGVGQALRTMSEPETDLVRRRVRVIAASPALRASTFRGHEATETRIRDQLITDGAPEMEAHVAAAALMAALTAALFLWAQDDELPVRTAVEAALLTLAGPGA